MQCLVCIAVACPSLTVANSDAASTAVTGSTGDYATVTCTNGYESADGFAFTVHCVGDENNPDSSVWNDSEGNATLPTCEGQTLFCVLCV